MPTVLAAAALVTVLGLAWRWSRLSDPPSEAAETERRGPTELVDAVPLVRGADGVWRPDRGDA